MKFKVGNIANGKRTSEEILEFESWFDAIDDVLSKAGLYLVELDEEGNEVE